MIHTVKGGEDVIGLVLWTGYSVEMGIEPNPTEHTELEP